VIANPGILTPLIPKLATEQDFEPVTPNSHPQNLDAYDPVERHPPNSLIFQVDAFQ